MFFKKKKKKKKQIASINKDVNEEYKEII